MKLLPFKACLLLILINFCFNIANAQDKVIMLNGDSKEGKVTTVRDDAIKFVYKGESLEYEFKKSDISEIVFESGRKETFNQSSTAAKLTTVNLQQKVDIL